MMIAGAIDIYTNQHITIEELYAREIPHDCGTIPRPLNVNSLTPRQIVEELDRYVIGQREAKRMVAIALRNRWRRQQLSSELRDEVMPKNIIMIGPTGVLWQNRDCPTAGPAGGGARLSRWKRRSSPKSDMSAGMSSRLLRPASWPVNMVKGKHLEDVQQKAERLGEEPVAEFVFYPRSGRVVPPDSPMNPIMRRRLQASRNPKSPRAPSCAYNFVKASWTTDRLNLM